MSSESWKIAKFTVGGTVVVALIGGVFGLIEANMKTSNSNTAPSTASPTAPSSYRPDPSLSDSALGGSSPSTPTTTPVSDTATGEQASTAPVSMSTTRAVVMPSPQYLSDIDPVGGWGNWMTQGGDTARGTTYGRSVICKLDGLNATSIPIEFTIPSGLKTFDATVGLDDKTPSGDKADFQVSLDGSVVSDQTLGVGATYNEHVVLGSAYRLTITMILVSDSGGIGHGVWGNARFTG